MLVVRSVLQSVSNQVGESCYDRITLVGRMGGGNINMSRFSRVISYCVLCINHQNSLCLLRSQYTLVFWLVVSVLLKK